MMNWIKKSPFFFLLLSTGILFTVVGIGGKDNIYAQQERDPVKTPVLSVVFTAMSEEIYPWQMFESGTQINAEAEETMVQMSAEAEEAMAQMSAEAEEITGQMSAEAEEITGQMSAEAEETTGQMDAGAEEAAEQIDAEGEATAEQTTPEMPDIQAAITAPTATPGKEPETAEPTATPCPTPYVPIEPFRETTQEEYLNHISADIYGDAGVLRAAEYGFVPVGLEWFEDAIFIGDSRTVGLRDYTDLSEYADFYSETSLTIYKVLDKNFGNQGTVPDALAQKDYGKIYLMVGINELGRGTTEDFMAKYTEVVDALREAEPNALIFIQGIMRVSQKMNSEDAIFNNRNIDARNNAIATLADNRQIFYIDVNEAVCDAEGNLNSEYTYDQIHLLGRYNELWKEFLMTRGVTIEETIEETALPD